jgi:hypothetical protein
MNTNNIQPFCKKIIYRLDDKFYDKPNILFGIIVSEDAFFVTFKTRYKEYTINRHQIISISDTLMVFDGVIPETQKDEIVGGQK